MRNGVLVLLICIIFLSQLNYDKVKSSWYTATSVGKDAQYTKTRKGFNALLSKIQRGSILFISNSVVVVFFLKTFTSYAGPQFFSILKKSVISLSL